MTDLYATLGVSRDATSVEITAAYRRAAKDAHPDADGGSEEKFHAIALAKRVLTDADKRARYDETGSIEDKPDARQSKALEIVASIITQLIDMPDAVYSDLVAAGTEALLQETHKQATAKIKAEADLEKTTKMRARFKAKPGKIDRIGILLDDRANRIRDVLAQMDEQLDVLELAKTMLADQTFDIEQRPAPAYQEWNFPSRQSGSIFTPFGR